MTLERTVFFSIVLVEPHLLVSETYQLSLQVAVFVAHDIGADVLQC